MKPKRKLPIYKAIGYILLLIYVLAAVCLLFFVFALGMIPTQYIIIAAVVMAIFAVIFAIMHERKIPSIIASVLTVILTAVYVIGAVYIGKTNNTISDVTTAEVQTDVVSMYVMNDDPAQTVNDAANYEIGIMSSVDRENTDKTIDSIESQLGSQLNIQEYNTMFDLADALKSGEVGAIIINEAYVGIIGDVENYEWMTTDIRQITTVEHAVESAPEADAEVSDETQNTFVMYLSGIDTYGGISARSRSDVNILAVVNTDTKNILLLSTPRDFYVDYSVTGGAKDKLTHAGIYGIDASIDALERLYDIDVNYYLRINFTGFMDVIDALGGISVYSDYEFTVNNVKTFQQGYNDVNGREALAFARERYSFADGDYQRGRNQMEVIRAVINKAASSSLLVNYTSVMDAIAGSFETNMPRSQIAALVRMQLSDMAQWNITSYTSSGQSMYAETFSMPGQDLYVIVPDENSIAEAKEQINAVLSGGQ